MPENLYKYRSFNKHTWDALETDTLWADKTSAQNDIREANIVLTKGAIATVCQSIYDGNRKRFHFPNAVVRTQEDILEAMRKNFEKSHHFESTKSQELLKSPGYKRLVEEVNVTFTALVDDIQKSIRDIYSVCCFSANKDNNQMWGYYSDNHTGCCIEYGFKRQGIDHEDVTLMFPVIYEEDNRIYCNCYDPEKGIDGSLAMLAATVKNQEYEFEQEWRRLYNGKTGGATRRMPKPTAVYMGERISEENKERLIQLCKQRDIRVFQMKYDQGIDKLCPLSIC